MRRNVDDLKPPGSNPPELPYTGATGAIARYFKFVDYKTNFRSEIFAGIPEEFHPISPRCWRGELHLEKFAIEGKHLTLQARIKRLARKTICFSKSENMHDLVIGLFINREEFSERDLDSNNKSKTLPPLYL